MNQTKKGRVTRREGIALTEDDMFTCVRFWLRLYRAVDEAVERWLTRPRIGDTRPGVGTVEFKPRQHFRADGTPKTKRTLAGAQRFCQSREGQGYRFYKCTVCRAYHVGHKVRARAA